MRQQGSKFSLGRPFLKKKPRINHAFIIHRHLSGEVCLCTVMLSFQGSYSSRGSLIYLILDGIHRQGGIQHRGSKLQYHVSQFRRGFLERRQRHSRVGEAIWCKCKGLRSDGRPIHFIPCNFNSAVFGYIRLLLLDGEEASNRSKTG